MIGRSGKETDGSYARALKHEISNPPYQGGKATEVIPREFLASGLFAKLSQNLFGEFRGLSDCTGGLAVTMGC